MKEKHSLNDIATQVATNSRIFKENLKLITSSLIEAVWRESVEPESLLTAVKSALQEFFQGNIEVIRETEEENVVDSVSASSKKFDKLTWTHQVAFSTDKVPPLPLPKSSTSINDEVTFSSGDFAFAESLSLTPPKKEVPMLPRYFPDPQPTPVLTVSKLTQTDPVVPVGVARRGGDAHYMSPGTTERKGVVLMPRRELNEKIFKTSFKGDFGRGKLQSPLCERLKSVSRSPLIHCLKELNKENSCGPKPSTRWRKDVVEMMGSQGAMRKSELVSFTAGSSFKRNFCLK